LHADGDTASNMASSVTVTDIRRARERFDPDIVRKTPVERSRSLSEMSGADVRLKMEHLQRTGSFKTRGASNKIHEIVETGEGEPSEYGDAGRVVAASAGNHAQGVALAASNAGIPSTVVMPEDAPQAKVDATRGYGAEVVLRVQGAQAAGQGEPVQQLELTFQHRDGSDVAVEINATAITDDGEITAIQGVGRDITERKKQQAEIRARTRAMDAAAVPITMADATRRDNPIIYANDAFERVTGYTHEQITGNNCRVLQGPHTDDTGVATLREGIAAQRPVTAELLNYRRDGTPFWNRITVTPVEDETGTVTRYLGFQEDVTEQQRTTRLVELLNRVLRHNLRNELTVIEGYTDFIHDPPPDIDIQAKIRSPLRRLVSLSESARELESLAKRDQQPVRLDPQTVLATVAENHREQFPSATIDITVDTDRGICAGEELETALGELVTNALVHSPGDDTVVSLTVHDDDDWVVVTVTDDGPGIPPSEVAVVEAGQETPLEHGTGLGLWLVNWVATHYGGSFRLTGEDGTVATLRLPAIGADQSVADVVRRPTALLW